MTDQSDEHAARRGPGEDPRNGRPRDDPQGDDPQGDDRPGDHRPQLVCASANPDKVAEIREILADSVDLLPRPNDVPDVVEDADTLVGNARLKAQAICAATGLPSVADDTGLEVDALGGAPGVYAARYAGQGCTYADNRAKLLTELDALGPDVDRAARFRTVVVIAYPDGSELIAEGVCDGTITRTEHGDRGFGYDAIFAPVDGDGATFAEMSDAAKNAISHRGRAFKNLVAALGHRPTTNND